MRLYGVLKFKMMYKFCRFKSVALLEDVLMLPVTRDMMNSGMIWLECLGLKGS